MSSYAILGARHKSSRTGHGGSDGGIDGTAVYREEVLIAIPY